MLEQLQFSVCPLRENRSAERLHNLLDGDILVGKLIPCRTAARDGTSLVSIIDIVIGGDAAEPAEPAGELTRPNRKRPYQRVAGLNTSR